MEIVEILDERAILPDFHGESKEDVIKKLVKLVHQVHKGIDGKAERDRPRHLPSMRKVHFRLRGIQAA